MSVIDDKQINSLIDKLSKLRKDMKLLLAIINTSLDDPNCDIPKLQEMISAAVEKLKRELR